MKFDYLKDFEDWVLREYPNIVKYYNSRYNERKRDSNSILNIGLRNYNLKNGQIYICAYSPGLVTRMQIIYIVDVKKNGSFTYYKTILDFRIRLKMGKIQKIWRGKLLNKQNTIFYGGMKYGDLKGYCLLYDWDNYFINWVNTDPFEDK